MLLFFGTAVFSRAARAWKWGPLLLFGPLLLLLFCFFGTAAGLSSRPSSYLAEF